jgi:hypothetical protein
MAVVLRPGDRNDLVRLLQARLNRDYPLYSNLVVDGIYGPATTAVVREFQRRAGLQVDGIAGPQTLGRLGLNFEQPPPLPTNLPFFYCASGTWDTPFQGPPFDVGFRLEQIGLVRNQPVGYPASGFLYPNPFMSYSESVALGVAELMRLIIMNAGKFYLCGYSQGAEVVVRTLRLMLPGQPLAHRGGDLLKAPRRWEPPGDAFPICWSHVLEARLREYLMLHGRWLHSRRATNDCPRAGLCNVRTPDREPGGPGPRTEGTGACRLPTPKRPTRSHRRWWHAVLP